MHFFRLLALLLLILPLIFPSTLPADSFLPPSLTGIEVFRQYEYHDQEKWKRCGVQLLREHPTLPGWVRDSLEVTLDEVLKRPLVQDPDVEPLGPCTDFSLIRSACKGLGRLALALADAGRDDEARTCLRAGLKLAVAVGRTSFGGRVSLINQMVSMAGINATANESCRYLSRFAPNAAAVLDLVHCLERMRSLRAPLSFALEYEHGNMLRLMSNLHKDPSLLGPDYRLTEAMVRRIVEYYDGDVGPLFRRYSELSRQPYPEVAEKIRMLEDELNLLTSRTKIPWYQNLWESWWDPARAISRILIDIAVPNFGGAARYDRRTEALLAGSIVAAGCRLFHLEHGYWPMSLSELPVIEGLEYPADPVSGRPWIFQRKEKGVRLYSSGDNGRDDGGKTNDGADDILILHGPLK